MAGQPESHFHRPDRHAWAAAHGVTLHPGMTDPQALTEILKAAIAKGRRDGPVFGLRLQQPSLGYLLDQLAILFPKAASDQARLQEAFGQIQFVYLTREDKVAQAISYVRAQQSGLWHQAADGTEIERQGPGQPLFYDADAIRLWYKTLIGFDVAWQSWFAAEGIAPLKLRYSELAAAPNVAAAAVLEHIGADPVAARRLRPGVRKLADATSQTWADRFRAEGGLLTPPGRSSWTGE